MKVIAYLLWLTIWGGVALKTAANPLESFDVDRLGFSAPTDLPLYILEGQQPQEIQQLLPQLALLRWHKLPDSQRTLGYKKNSQWYRAEISAKTRRPAALLAVIRAPFIDRIDGYLLYNNELLDTPYLVIPCRSANAG